jgi:hypothetical protein
MDHRYFLLEFILIARPGLQAAMVSIEVSERRRGRCNCGRRFDRESLTGVGLSARCIWRLHAPPLLFMFVFPNPRGLDDGCQGGPAVLQRGQSGQKSRILRPVASRRGSSPFVSSEAREETAPKQKANQAV